MAEQKAKVEQKSGGPTSYYLVRVDNPNQAFMPYQAECGDIIEALQMDFNEGNEFKAIWRTASARILEVVKAHGDAKYDAQKRMFYANRSLSLLEGKKVDMRRFPETLEEAQNMMQEMVNMVPDFREFLRKQYKPPAE